jgi:hypothetical protein
MIGYFFLLEVALLLTLHYWRVSVIVMTLIFIHSNITRSLKVHIYVLCNMLTVRYPDDTNINQL